MYVASKYSEECGLDLQELKKASANVCQPSSVVAIEREVLRTLDYSMSYTHIAHFVDLFCSFFDLKIETECLFSTCCCLRNAGYLNYKPSLLAVAIVSSNSDIQFGGWSRLGECKEFVTSCVNKVLESKQF